MKKIISFVIIFLSLTNVSYSKNELYEKIDLFGEVLEKIKKDYVDDDVNQSKMIEQRKRNTPSINFESNEDSLDGFDLAEFDPR